MKKQPLITLNLSCHFEGSLKIFHSLIFSTWILGKVPNFLFHIPGEQQHSWQNVTDLRILPGVCQLLPQQEIIYFFKEKFFCTCNNLQKQSISANIFSSAIIFCLWEICDRWWRVTWSTRKLRLLLPYISSISFSFSVLLRFSLFFKAVFTATVN